MVEVIAEMGIAHLGNLDKARALADYAKAAGAEAVKTQTYDPKKLLRPGDKDEKLLTEVCLSKPDTVSLSKYCADIGIEFLSTPGEIDSLKFLVQECGVRRIKIGSDDLTYEPLLHAAYETKLPIILSTGMSDSIMISDALPQRRYQYPSITLMHCVSLYPTPFEKANLLRIKTLSNFGYRVGYSDHTLGMVAVYMAIALGATTIEKHFCPYNYDGPDKEVSLLPEELRLLVAGAKEYEKLLGTGQLNPSREETENIPKFRKDRDGFRGWQT